MLRNRLRNLEQQVNASDLPDSAKVKLQSYVSGCYGSLTSFNVLFADEDDQFKGSGGDESARMRCESLPAPVSCAVVASLRETQCACATLTSPQTLILITFVHCGGLAVTALA